MRSVLLLLAVVVAAACGGHDRPPVTKLTSFPGALVEADGHNVYFDCKGRGNPTVVFLSGWGAEAATWDEVFDAVSKETRACTYDRYGVGLTAQYGTAMARRARDAKDQARELEQLLHNADIPKPYVLIGHSWGGALARLYAATHDDVQAVVFVDSASPGQDTALTAALPPRKPGEPAELTQLRDPTIYKALQRPEYLTFRKSLREVGAVGDLGDLPIVVITAGGTFSDATRLLYPTWIRLQNRIAGLSSRSVHVLATTSGHFVQVDDPQLTEAAIAAAVGAARDDGKLVSCAAVFRGVGGARCLSG
jgi:pimeloyl-ACP methyl ester carboxylesterase